VLLPHRQTRYIIIDAPGHIEFLKNMISGAARAEAGLLVIDVAEGVRENSRRHGYLMSMLGIRQIAVCVNKMDLVDYRQEAFAAVRDEYGQFLAKIGLERWPSSRSVPAKATTWPSVARAFPGSRASRLRSEGGTPSTRGPRRLATHVLVRGATILDLLDTLQKDPAPVDKPLRLPVRTFTSSLSTETIGASLAGRIVTGRLHVGDEVVFLPAPSGRASRASRHPALCMRTLRPAKHRRDASKRRCTSSPVS